MTRKKLLNHINYALDHIQYGEEREKEIKKAFKKMKKDLDQLKKLKKAIEILKKHFDITGVDNEDDTYFSIVTHLYAFHDCTKEEYEVLKEVL